MVAIGSAREKLCRSLVHTVVVMPRESYSPNTASKIRSYIRNNPGCKAREIASAVGLRKETVNSYLYSRKANALGGEVTQDSEYGWHLKGVSGSKSYPSAQPSKPSNPTSNQSVPKSAPSDYGWRSQPPTNPVDKTTPNTRNGINGYSYPYRGSGTFSNPPSQPPSSSSPNKPTSYSDDLFQRSHPPRKKTLSELRAELLENKHDSQKVVALFRSDDFYSLKDEEQMTLARMLTPKAREQFLQEKLARDLERAKASEIIDVEPITIEYSPEVIKEVFKRDDYHALSDEEQGKLAEMLEAAERERQAAERERRLIEKRAQELAEQKVKELTKARRWLPVVYAGVSATLIGFMAYTLTVVRQPLPKQPTSIERVPNK